eukprot:4143250-Karenia_brevis.AAC.1
MKIDRDIFQEIGYTKSCYGCNALRMNKLNPQAHSEKCRARVEEYLSGTEEGKAKVEASHEKFKEASAAPATNQPASSGGSSSSKDHGPEQPVDGKPAKRTCMKTNSEDRPPAAVTDNSNSGKRTH